MVRFAAILLLAVTLHGADTPPLPSLIVPPEDTNGPAFYTLKSLAWDGEATNYFIHIATSPLGPWRILNSTTNRVEIPDLAYSNTYYLCVQAQAGDLVSVLSPMFQVPPDRMVWVTRTESWFINGVWSNGLAITLTNPPGNQFWRIKVGTPNKIQQAAAEYRGDRTTWLEVPGTRSPAPTQIPPMLLVEMRDNNIAAAQIPQP